MLGSCRNPKIKSTGLLNGGGLKGADDFTAAIALISVCLSPVHSKTLSLAMSPVGATWKKIRDVIA